MTQCASHTAPSAWVEIDLSAARHNFREIRRIARRQLAPRINRSIDILSVVKADSYGHGMVEISRVIEKEGGRFFVVSNIDEALTLRQSGNRHRILILEATLPSIIPLVLKNNITPCLCTLDFARALDRAAAKAGKRMAVHIKVDTGMSRLGVFHTHVLSFARDLMRLKNLDLEGILTHLPVADTNRDFTEKQLASFSDVVADMIKEGIPFHYLHAANSMGLGGYKNRYFNLVRPGVMLYGLYPDDSLRSRVALRPVMTVKATVLFTKEIERGRGISYGHTFRPRQKTRVAIISIGYSDGYRRAFSNCAHVLVRGKKCPVLGRVTMDQTIVDISHAGKVSIGDEVVVIGRQGRELITADDLARWAGTINYEIVCNLGNRLPRIYKR